MVSRSSRRLDCISIHALREESDEEVDGDWCGYGISIHALREESDSNVSFSGIRGNISIHALREESDANSRSPASHPNNFNPRSP